MLQKAATLTEMIQKSIEKFSSNCLQLAVLLSWCRWSRSVILGSACGCRWHLLKGLPALSPQRLALELLYLLQDLLCLLPRWHSLLQKALSLGSPVCHLQVLFWQEGWSWGGKWWSIIFVRGFGLRGLEGSRKAQEDLLTLTGRLHAAPQMRGVNFIDLHWITSFYLRRVRNAQIWFKWLQYRRHLFLVCTRSWFLRFWWRESVNGSLMRWISPLRRIIYFGSRWMGSSGARRFCPFGAIPLGFWSQRLSPSQTRRIFASEARRVTAPTPWWSRWPAEKNKKQPNWDFSLFL